jgi:hypothetical protein
LKANDTEIQFSKTPFTDKNGQVFSAQCTIRRRGHAQTIGAIPAEELFPLIKDGEPLVVSNCVVWNFSASDYRNWAGLGESESVTLNNVLAVNSWFCTEGEAVLDFSFCTFQGVSAQFMNSKFMAGEINFMRTDFSACDADFTNASFTAENQISFQYARFGSDTASFENSLFTGSSVSFVNASFKSRNTVFRNSEFRCQKAEFHFGRFGDGNVSFEKCTFHGDLDFRKTEFGKGKLDFRRNEFRGRNTIFDEMHGERTRTSFNRSVVHEGHFSFEKCDMPANELRFEQCNFGTASLSFFASSMDAIIITGSQLNGYTDLRVEACNRLDLENCVIRDVLDLKKGETTLNIGQLRMPGVRNLGMIIADWEDNAIFHHISSQQDTTDSQKADQFRIFKEAFNSNGLYEDEDKAYVEFKRYELKHNHAMRLKRKGIASLTAWPRKWFQQLLFDRMGLYATDPFRVLISMVLVYCAFSLLYFGMMELGWGELKAGADPPEALSNLAVAFYHSAITFFTIGYGDYSPWGALRIVAAVEGFIGVFMMAYFTVAFVRKILR